MPVSPCFLRIWSRLVPVISQTHGHLIPSANATSLSLKPAVCCADSATVASAHYDSVVLNTPIHTSSNTSRCLCCTGCSQLKDVLHRMPGDWFCPECASVQTTELGPAWRTCTLCEIKKSQASLVPAPSIRLSTSSFGSSTNNRTRSTYPMAFCQNVCSIGLMIAFPLCVLN